MRGRLALVVVAMALALSPASAQAAFGFVPGSEGFDAMITRADGAFESQAGAHPSALEFELALNSSGGFSDGDLRDLHLQLPAGLLLNPTAVPECSQALFHTPRVSPYEESRSGESCPNMSQIGTIALKTSEGGGETRTFGLYNLTPPYGSPGALGASPYGVPIVLTPQIREADAGLTFDLEGLSQAFDLQSIDLTIWGTPWGSPTSEKEIAPSPGKVIERVFTRDNERGNCLNELDPTKPFGEPGRLIITEESPGKFSAAYIGGTCSVVNPTLQLEKSYLTLPTTPCGVPLTFSVSASSWQGAGAGASIQSHDPDGDPASLTACNKALTIPKAQLRTDRAAIGSGLVFNLNVNDGGGILNPGGIARPAVKTAIVSMPEGLTINPSVGSGLGACSETEFAREGIDTAPGSGCPNQSKLGTIEVQGMLGLPEPIKGSLFLAQPYTNPSGTLLALYMVARDPRRGILVKSHGKIEPDSRTGRLTATFTNLPRLLYTHFELSLREGQRAMLISPALCGNYPTEVEMASWAEPTVFSHDTTSYFPILHGPDGGACPTSSARPFTPGLQAGSLNPNAASYSPFFLQMTRTDSEQEISSYSATFPPGLLGKIAGIPYCPDLAIEAAKSRSGTDELRSPSCPAASSIGHTLAGYGVGGVLAYAPGALYLAGPYHGSPLSVVAIDSALVGPFDLGVVVVRSAIRIDRQTAQASIDSSGSDPIPHMLKGVPLHLRDIRVYVDRPNFTLNPTDCDPLQSLSTLTGSGADPSNPADDVAAISTDRFQLLNCSALGFRPRLSLHLRGGNKHGDYPSLRAVYAPRPGHANIDKAAVTLPPSVFLAQEHLDTICTQAQFDRQACPPGSVYGRARVFTPLLDQPLEGPVYLRSSVNPLPDLVAALRGAGGLAVDVVGRIDSHRSGIRARFANLPDAPVTKFVMALHGGRHGLLVNEKDMCRAPQLAAARLVGHNNLGLASKPPLQAQCKHRKAGRK